MDDANLYYTDYDGYHRMKWHDAEENALKRWFENFKVNKFDHFASDYECLVVSEVPSTSKRGGKRYHCDIIDEGRGTQREVVMDHTAPKPPTIFFAAKRKYVPPPPKTPSELRREEEYARMRNMGYVPRKRPVYRMPTKFDPNAPLVMPELEYEIEWVREDPPRWHLETMYMPMTRLTAYTPPPAPKHRRNV